MKRHGGGTFISVSSVEGEVSLPYHAAYAAAKHGVNGAGCAPAWSSSTTAFPLPSPR